LNILSAMKPRISNTMKPQENQLKYFSTYSFTVGPNHLITAATQKNRNERPMIDAVRKLAKLYLNRPDAMVKTL